MPSSSVSTFGDPDDYAASFHTAKAELSVTGRGSFDAKVIRVDLGRLRMHRFRESLQRVGHWANFEARAVVTFATQPGPTLLFDGVEMRPTSITRHSVFENGFLRSSGPASWGSMSLSVEELAAAGTAITGSDLTPPKDYLVRMLAPVGIRRVLPTKCSNRNPRWAILTGSPTLSSLAIGHRLRRQGLDNAGDPVGLLRCVRRRCLAGQILCQDFCHRHFSTDSHRHRHLGLACRAGPARVAALRPLARVPRPGGGAGAARQTRPGPVSGLLRPCLLVRRGAKTAARSVLSMEEREDDLQRGI
jgi:hypothetical protein